MSNNNNNNGGGRLDDDVEQGRGVDEIDDADADNNNDNPSSHFCIIIPFHCFIIIILAFVF